MATSKMTYTLEKVHALRSYFLKLRNSSRGKSEYDDIDTTVKLCEQLISVMEQKKTEATT
jgi:hypothetical protein